MSANISGSGKALAYAIARQESAFNPAAVSPANARGLLQLLPGTAKGVASRHGMAYTQAKLTTDAGYNATLGAHYLGEQIDSFGGSYILTFIAYNAGPKRVPEWIARYGIRAENRSMRLWIGSNVSRSPRRATTFSV